MWTTYINTVRATLRTPSAIVWTLVFPIVLATVFNFMFEPIRAADTMQPVPVAAVADDNWRASAFSSVAAALDEADDGDRIIELHKVATERAARELLEDGEVDGIYVVDADGTPRAIVASANAPAHASDASYEIDRAIVQGIVENYAANHVLAASAAHSGAPAAGISPARTQATVRQVSLTHAEPDAAVRFYYALLGMAVMFSAQIACEMTCALVPTISRVGARRSVSGMSRVRQLVPTVAGCWSVAVVFLGAVLAYICATGGIDFAGREALCLLGIALSALLATCLGALAGAIPLRGGSDVRSGFLTAITCLLSLFAGLFGEATMELSDAIARTFPAAMWVNPVSLVRDVFYSLYYYDTLVPFALRLCACIGFAAAFFAVAAALLRRQRYDHL